MPKALIAMSGGVDSSVAAFLTQQAGYDCIGCTMKLYDNADEAAGKTCCSLDDVEDARSVARRLGMPFYVFNFKDDFREKVIGKFIDSYLHGCTPNPCIDCNRFMKFEKLHLRARELGCNAVVTGHYARIEQTDDGYVLRKALDPSKDQSYVLYSLSQTQLAHTLFPLGGMTKNETRALAEANGFINAGKPDSQDICFVPDGDYARVIEQYAGNVPPPGDFSTTDGRVLGRHKGIIHYTIGQRKGLGIAADAPYFVCAIRPEDNTVVLGRPDDLLSGTANVPQMHWISGHAPTQPIKCRVKIRYRQPEQDARVTPTADGGAVIEFASPQRAVTPGQAAVLYDGDIVLGGGTIA